LYQSLAIIQYLEETHPEPRLIPVAPLERNRVRSLALIIACEIHPLNNTRVLNYLTGNLGLTEDQKREWYHHWVKTGFTALEKRLATEPWTGRFCHGDTPGFADISLVPQVANANRFKVDLTAFLADPTTGRVPEAGSGQEARREPTGCVDGASLQFANITRNRPQPASSPLAPP
jgi:maleylacetoacetate isomerase